MREASDWSIWFGIVASLLRALVEDVENCV